MIGAHLVHVHTAPTRAVHRIYIPVRVHVLGLRIVQFVQPLQTFGTSILTSTSTYPLIVLHEYVR